MCYPSVPPKQPCIIILLPFVQSEATCEVRAVDPEDELGDEVGGSASEFAEESPSLNSSILYVSAASHDVAACLLLLPMLGGTH